MGFAPNVFVSSACHELRDLRAGVRDWLTGMGFNPILSDDTGFPHRDNIPPYAACLQTMDECLLVIGVIDRYYGQAFDDWGPFPRYAGLAPTHAELRHALDTGKRALIYVHNDTWSFYEVWRKNPEVLAQTPPHGLDVRTLQMFHELKTRSPAPWLSRFSDVSSLLTSLKAEIINHLFSYLREREQETANLTQYLLSKLGEAPPETRQHIAEALNSELVAERDALQAKLAAIDTDPDRAAGAPQETIDQLNQEKLAAEARLAAVTQQLTRVNSWLAHSAAKDAVWLNLVRRTMMPTQPSRVPFHNSLEVAMRGYHAAAGRRVAPILSQVTWEKLEQVEGGLHRGYHAGIIFRGADFVPGITWTMRRTTPDPASETHYQTPWMLPNIYWGTYLEVSVSDDPVESPLSYRDSEFQVRNPEGQTSEWVKFSYPFDDAMLERIRVESLRKGRELLAAGKPIEAVEPMRKAYTFTDRMLGLAHEDTVRIKAEWNRAIDEAALAKLRFRAGDYLVVTSGPESGKSGVVDRLLLRHVHAYVIKTGDGNLFQASDAQVERAQAAE
jgi:hypothetical protein